jgi:heat-inducible transcriptional repressor
MTTIPPDLDLTQRRRQVLRAVIEEHISTGLPVGSQTLVRTRGFATSASTLRYELAWLESVGLLGHPHTSAGRVPTDLGYRFYAHNLSRFYNCDWIIGRAPAAQEMPVAA